MAHLVAKFLLLIQAYDLIHQPDNTILISLLNEWAKDMSKNNYIKVRRELIDGNSFLMLPAPGKNEAISEKWDTSSEASRIHLSSLYTIGLTGWLKVAITFQRTL